MHNIRGAPQITIMNPHDINTVVSSADSNYINYGTDTSTENAVIYAQESDDEQNTMHMHATNTNINNYKLITWQYVIQVPFLSIYKKIGIVKVTSVPSPL